MRSQILLLAVAVGVAAGVRAQPKPSHVPMDAAIVFHVDLKELGASPMGHFLRQSLDDNARRGLEWLQSACGVNLTNDVDAFVAYAQGKLQTTGVVQIAYGRFDVAKMTAVAGGTKEFQNKALGERSLLSWSENAKRKHACFIDPSMLMLTWDEQPILQTAARIDGPAQAADSASPFAQALSRKPGRFLVVQANRADALPSNNPQLQVLRQADALLLEVGQLSGTNGLDCVLTVKARNQEVAQQMFQAAQGVQALLMLQAAQNPEVATLAQGAKVSMQDDFVTVSLMLSEDTLKKFIQVRVEQRNAAKAARRAARQAAHEDAAEEEAAKKPERQAF